MKRRQRRRRGASTSSTSGMCYDVLRNIFARVPARTAVASMALSTHHRRLMRCPDFRALHCRLAPPLPDPQVAYIAMAKVRRSGVSGYHGFHVAGLGGSSSNAPMRSLAGPAYLDRGYVNTCNGVVLLAGRPRSDTCVLWNPAVADEEKEVTVPVSTHYHCSILGLGYGSRTKTYKILLMGRIREPYWDRKELLVYALGGPEEQPRALLSKGLDGEISGQSLYIDGTIYLLNTGNSTILAFDVDDETVTAIDLPGPGDPRRRRAMSGLSAVSCRPCVDMQDVCSRALWLLTAEHRWEMKCSIKGHGVYGYSLAGAWDCGGMLLVYMHIPRGEHGKDDKLFIYCNETKKMTYRSLPSLGLTPESTDYALCWGYKPTLVSPGSIAGELDPGEERRRERMVDIMAALKPVNERDRREGQEATLDTVCFMEFLLRIMRSLPENMQDVTGMPLKPEDSYSDSDSSEDSDSSVG